MRTLWISAAVAIGLAACSNVGESDRQMTVNGSREAVALFVAEQARDEPDIAATTSRDGMEATLVLSETVSDARVENMEQDAERLNLSFRQSGGSQAQ